MQEAKIARLLGGEKVLNHKIRSELDFADVISQGFPVEAIKALQGYLALNDVVMAGLVSLSPKTFRQRTLFKGNEGNHAYTLARIIVAAEDALGDRDAALEWLQQQQTALGGRMPLELVATSAGAQAVEDVLGRIKYGVYS